MGVETAVAVTVAATAVQVYANNKKRKADQRSKEELAEAKRVQAGDNFFLA